MTETLKHFAGGKKKNTHCNPPKGEILFVNYYYLSCSCKELMAGSSHGRGVLSVGLGSAAV